MKKLVSAAVALSTLVLSGCNATMEVNYTPVIEMEAKTDWEIDPVKGS